MKQTLTCIVCPMGCTLTVECLGESVCVSGNTCPRGREYGISEVLHPVRTVTAAVRVANRENTMAPVKTAVPVPKEQVESLAATLRHMTVLAPISIGQIIMRTEDGQNVVATKRIE